MESRCFTRSALALFRVGFFFALPKSCLESTGKFSQGKKNSFITPLTFFERGHSSVPMLQHPKNHFSNKLGLN